MKRYFEFISMLIVAIFMAACTDSYDDPVSEEKTEEPEKETPGNSNSGKENEYTPLVFSRAERKLVVSQKSMAWEMLQLSVSKNNGEDVVISPLCTQIALAMVANGMDQESCNKVLNILKTHDLDSLNEIYNRVITTMPSCNPDGVKTNMSFANWQNSRVEFVPAFAKVLEEIYHVPTFKYDFWSVDMMSIVNKWVGESTGGLIPAIISEPIDPETAMVLCNSLYLDCKWSLPFDKTLTKVEDFQDLQGKIVGQAPMMRHGKTTIHYYEQYNKYKQARLSFKGQEFYMYIYLPLSDCNSLDELIESVKKQEEERMEEKYGSYMTPELVMPKFGISYSSAMNEIIKDMGVDLKSLNYSGISKNVKEIEIKQSSSITVDEEGTLAASATIQYGKLSWGGENPEIGEPFIVDRPFVYTIENTNGLILFIGTMSNPCVK